jgi:F0F1-type ATP synthase assembly protein I
MKQSGDDRPVRNAYATYLRFMGLGLTMAGIIIAFTFLGWWLDGLLEWKIPVLTIVLALLGVVGAMFHLLRETGRKDL